MKRLAKWIFAIAIVVVVLLIALPQLMSSGVVKNRIAAQLTEITGREVTLNGSSSISLRPYLGVTYSDARIASSDDDNGNSLATVEELRVQLGFASAFWGQAKVSNVTLIRPRFNLEVDANGTGNWQLQDGEFAKRLNTSEGQEPEPLSLGSAEIVDGTVKLNDQLNRVTTELTAVNGAINWSDITSALKSNLTAVWNGEIANIEIAADSPLNLIRGGVSNARVVVKSKPLTIVYDGTIDTKLNTASGKFSSITPSMKSAADWLSIQSPLANMTTTFELGGDINVAEGKVAIENASVTLGEHQGTGQLQFSKKNAEPLTISGTLAFETLEIPTLPLLSYGGNQTAEQPGHLDISKLDDVDLDVGVSAKSVNIGSLNAENVAASMMLRKGGLRLEIGNAEILGGTIAGFLDGQPKPETFDFKADLSLSQVNLEQMSSLVSGTEKGLTGSGDAEVKLNTEILAGSVQSLNVNGELDIKSADGTINGIDLSAVYNLSNQNETDGKDAQVQYVDGITPYDTLKLKILIANNTALLREGSLANPTLNASLTGRGELNVGTLALRGDIQGLVEESGILPRPLPFFIGGTVSSPLFVPLPRPSLN